MAGTKRSCRNRFCCFSSSASDEEGQGHPASAGPRSSSSAIDNTTETLPGPPKPPEAPISVSSNVVTPMEYEREQHVDPNLDVSGTHQCDKTPLSESQNILRISEGEDVNTHLNVSGFPQCDEPSSSGSSNVPVKPQGEHVDVNPNVSEKHIGQADGKKMDVNLDELEDHISKLLKLREEEMLPNKKASNPSNFSWPNVPGLKKLKAILSRIYPEEAVGIDESIEDVVSLLEIESVQNAVMVILHGFGGMGKTTLADAVVSKDTVVSKLVGFKYSKVRMREDSDIVNLQKEILEDLMEPGDTISKIKTPEDGQRELRKRLEQVQAFIYIDDVLDGDALKQLLPEDMSTAKKVRLLLTARNANVKNPRRCIEAKIYKVEGIQHQPALTILKRKIEDGLNDNQFNDIIDTCGGIPLMLTMAAASIGGAVNKEEAYAALMEQKEKWTGGEEMRYAFAYHAIPSDFKEPFLDICTYFNGWKWDIVEDMVGKSELRAIENRALVDKTRYGFASVHDVILRLAHQMSKEESKDKEVRCKFTNASELKKFLEEGDTEGIRGIWLTERKDVPKEEEDDDDDRKEVVVQASALDKFHKSLRFLQLGNSIKVEGNCNEIFKELVFFKAKISQLPFDDVSQLPQLRYLSYGPANWVLSSLPSSLAIMNFNGKTFQTYK